jgi:hypothetical protein
MEAAIIKMTMALTLTILFELLAYWLFIKKSIPKDERLLWGVFIIGLNLFTNPLANMAYAFLSTQILLGASWIITELLVILIEALLIRMIMLVKGRKALFYSLVLNGTSILLGELLLWVL